MENIYTKLALYGNKIECARTDTVFFKPISEVCDGTVSLMPREGLHYTLHTAHSTLHTLHCTLHTAHCTLAFILWHWKY